jgi:hypothetical protein
MKAEIEKEIEEKRAYLNTFLSSDTDISDLSIRGAISLFLDKKGALADYFKVFELEAKLEGISIGEQKAQDVELTYGRIKEVINLVDCGKLSDEQGIKRIMKAITKQVNRQIKKELR